MTEIRGLDFATKLGSGGASKVYLCVTDDCARGYAAKLFRVRSCAVDDFLHEVRMHEELRHEAIVRMVDHTSGVGDCIIFFERGDCSLFEVLQQRSTLSLDEIRSKLRLVLEAVHFIHLSGYAHCDVKPENILQMPGGDLKLIDLGQVTRVGPGEFIKGGARTPGYLAPEMHTEGRFGKAADVWMLAVVLFCAATGRFPYEYSGPGWEDALIDSGRIDLDVVAELPGSEAFVDLLSHMFEFDPARRYTIGQCLQHHFFCDTTHGCETAVEGMMATPHRTSQLELHGVDSSYFDFTPYTPEG
jgi:serine/threonine protein kinase